jgi:serine/threonine protein kinase
MIGEQIGVYRITQKLGQGGMGVVFKAVDTTLDRVVAVKLLNSDVAMMPELVERFRSEARVQAGLSHPNLTTLHAFLVWQGVPVMVMEFIEGETFQQMMARTGPIPAEACLPLFQQVLRGVGAAHRRGIIHRDIKPANIMLNEHGLVKVMDFGIAKVLGVSGATRTNMQMGTSWYMSPEQIMVEAVDARSDIYSLGVMLYEMLAGRVPFRADSEFAVQMAHMQTVPEPPTLFCPGIPPYAAAAVMKALAKAPGDRFASVEEFLTALNEGGMIPAYPTPRPTQAPVLPTGAPRRFSRWPILGAAAGIAAVIAGGSFYYLDRDRQHQQEAEKQRQSVIEKKHAEEIAQAQAAAAEATTALPMQTNAQEKTTPKAVAKATTPQPVVAQPPQAPETPPPSQPPNPAVPPARAAAFKKLTGVWKGSFTCEDGQTAAELQINATPEGVSAVMSFDVPNSKPGRFLMNGAFFPFTKVLHLRFVSWDFHPPKHRFVNISGTVDLQKGTITGRAISPGCSAFSAHRQ